MRCGRDWCGLASFPSHPSLAIVRNLGDEVLDGSSPHWWYVLANVVVHVVQGVEKTSRRSGSDCPGLGHSVCFDEQEMLTSA